MPRNHNATLLFAVLSVLLLWSVPASARIEIDITSAEMRKVVVALPHFINPAMPDQVEERGVQMADLLGRALELHGFLKFSRLKAMTAARKTTGSAWGPSWLCWASTTAKATSWSWNSG